MRLRPLCFAATLAMFPLTSMAETLDVKVYTPYEVQQEMVVEIHDQAGFDPKPLVSGPPTAIFTLVMNGEERRVPVWMRTIPNAHNDMIRVEYAVEGDYPVDVPAQNYAPGYGPQGYLKPGESAPEASTLVKDWGLAVLLPGESFEMPIKDSNATIRATLRMPVVETITVRADSKPWKAERARPFDNRAGTVP